MSVNRRSMLSKSIACVSQCALTVMDRAPVRNTTERFQITAPYCPETVLSGRDALAILQPKQLGARQSGLHSRTYASDQREPGRRQRPRRGASRPVHDRDPERGGGEPG